MSRKNIKNKQDRVFEVFLLVGIIFAIPIALLVGFFGGETFNAILFLIILFSVSLFVVIIYLVLTSAKIRGRIGELRVARRLKKLAKKYDGYCFNNIMVTGEDGNSSEIDHILVSRYGVFVVETKNMIGNIYGDDEVENWTQVLPGGKVKNKFYSPVKQNRTHIYRLKGAIGVKDVDFDSVVVFVNGNLKHVNSNFVYSFRELKRLINKNSEYLLEQGKLNSIYNKILRIEENPQVSKEEHLARIRQNQEQINNRKCPRCGKDLVEIDLDEGTLCLKCSDPGCSFATKIDKK